MYRIFIFLFLGISIVGKSQQIDTTFWVTDGPVYSMCADTSNNNLFIAGAFTHMGPNIPYITFVDSSVGLPFNYIPNPNGSVTSVSSDGNGGWFVAGSFTHIGKYDRTNLAHIDRYGNVLPWNPLLTAPFTTSVTAILYYNSRVYFAGNFQDVNGQLRMNLASVDAVTGTTTTSWNPGSNTSIVVYTLKGHGTGIYVGGTFSQICGQSRSGFAVVDTLGNLLTPNTTVPNGYVLEIEFCGNNAIIMGRFTTFSGQSRQQIALLNTNTLSLNPLSLTFDANVNAIASNGQKFYVGGTFNQVSSQNRRKFAEIDTLTGLTNWSAGLDSLLYASSDHINSICTSGSRLYFVGAFNSVFTQARNCVGALDLNSGTVLAFNPLFGLSTMLNGIYVSGLNVSITGDFCTMGNQMVPRMSLACIDLHTGLPKSWNPAVNGQVFGIALNDSLLYVGGGFTTVNSVARHNIASIGKTTGLLTSWDPSANGYVNTVAASDSTVYVGGNFTTISSQSRSYLCSYNTSTGLLNPWNPAPDYYVNIICPSDSQVYVGGQFANIGTQARTGLASLLKSSGNATSWNPNPNGYIYAISIIGKKVLFGGSFPDVNGTPISGLALVSKSTGSLDPWRPGLYSLFSSIEVNSMATIGNRFYVGGDFTTIGTQNRRGFAAFDTMATFATTWNPYLDVTNSNPTSIAVVRNKVFLGGSWLNGTNRRLYFQALSPDISNSVTGYIFDDMNHDGIRNNGEPGFGNIPVAVSPGNSVYFSNASGLYTAFTDTGSFIYTPSQVLYYNDVPTFRSATFHSNCVTDTAYHFACQPIPNVKDLRISLTAYLNITHGPVAYTISYKNVGTITQSGSVVLVHDSHLTYTSSIPVSSYYANDTIKWSYSNLQPGESRSIQAKLFVPYTVILGTQIRSAAEVDPVANDTVPADNRDSLIQVVVVSHDPNVKEVNPAGTGPQGIVSINTSLFQYTIHFQNNGTGTASTVAIKDTLSSNLDESTFQFIGSSHPSSYSISNHVLTIIFNNIQLPDSAADPIGSQGFFKYAIEPIHNPPPGTIIKNQAYIYFDYNTPVLTNITTNTLQALITSIKGPNTNYVLSVYPNPSNGSCTIVSDFPEADMPFSLLIYNHLGQSILHMDGISSSVFSVDLHQLPEGIYFLELSSKNRENCIRGKLILNR
jgi:hypothetical protein